MHRLQVTAELIPDSSNGGYTVYCPEFDVMTQGDDPDDCIANLREALRGYIKTIGIKQAFKEYRKLIRLLNHILRKARLLADNIK